MVMPFQASITSMEIFLLCLPGLLCGPSVTYNSTKVCGLKGASVVLPCTYQYSHGDTYQGGEWYKQGSGRVIKHSNSKYPNCSLNIDKLSDDDSGVYQFQFYTVLHMAWITARSGVTLSVTDIQVKKFALPWNQNMIQVSCSTSCSLGSHLQYIWYKNGQTLQDKTTASILLDSTRPSAVGRYSCAVRGHEARRSPAVCVPKKQCWGVTYSSTSICALLNSSVDIPCTYKYPQDHRIKTTFWFNKQKSYLQPKDISLEKEYKNHVQYLGNKGNNCTLRLIDIRERHSGEYAFRFITEQGEGSSGLPGVIITVRTLQVLITPTSVRERDRVTLTCSTTCSVSNNTTFIWYKNGQPVTHKHSIRDNKLHLNPVNSEDAGNYSCAVRGHESLSSTDVFLNIKYSPRNVSLSISPGGGEAGSPVTLTCSSDANPPVHTYTWFMKSGAESAVRGTGESISFSVTSDTSGLYYCEAQNEVGSTNSDAVTVVLEDEHVAAMMMPARIILFVILTITLVFGTLWLRKKKKNNLASTPYTIEGEASDVYTNVMLTTMTSDPGQRGDSQGNEDDVHYASIQFQPLTKKHKSLRSNDKSAQQLKQDEDVVYASVQPS